MASSGATGLLSSPRRSSKICPSGIVVADFAPDIVGQLGLADATLPVDGRNGGRFAVAQPCDEFVDVVLAAGEIGDGVGEQRGGGLDFRWFFLERLASFSIGRTWCHSAEMPFPKRQTSELEVLDQAEIRREEVKCDDDGRDSDAVIEGCTQVRHVWPALYGKWRLLSSLSAKSRPVR